MQKRQSTVQKFSTFLSFTGDRKNPTPQWTTDPRLERNIQQQLHNDPEKTAELWSLYFLKLLLNETTTNQHYLASKSRLAENHLSAYLQEPCYQAAQKIQKQFQSIRYKYALEDLFQIGNVFVSEPAKLFRSFKLDHQGSLEGYAKTAIFRFIGNTIYAQDIEAKREKFSDYGLLRDLNNKELKEALAARGICDRQSDPHCLTRHCFNAVCQPQTRQGSRSSEAPSPEDLVQIASCYNQQRGQFNLPNGLADAKTIQELLSTCIQAARDYRTKRVLALDNDDLICDPMPTPWETVIQTEEQEQMQSLVAEIFATLPEMGQTLFKLWLGLNLTQTEIATVLKSKYPELQKQYQVARHVGKYSKNFLKAFLQQCQQLNYDLELQDDGAISLIQALLDECLQSYCNRLISAHLEQFEGQDCSPIESQQDFVQRLERQLEKELELPSESLRFVHEKVADVVGKRLQSAEANLFSRSSAHLLSRSECPELLRAKKLESFR